MFPASVQKRSFTYAPTWMMPSVLNEKLNDTVSCPPQQALYGWPLQNWAYPNARYGALPWAKPLGTSMRHPSDSEKLYCPLSQGPLPLHPPLDPLPPPAETQGLGPPKFCPQKSAPLANCPRPPFQVVLAAQEQLPPGPGAGVGDGTGAGVVGEGVEGAGPGAPGKHWA